jgi:hypothetical protein
VTELEKRFSPDTSSNQAADGSFLTAVPNGLNLRPQQFDSKSTFAHDWPCRGGT